MQREIRFNDDAGVSWRICEVRSGDPKPRKGAPPSTKHEHTHYRGLYFFSRYTTKRLADFPANWSRLAPNELTALCDSAESLRNVETMTDEHAVPIPLTRELRTREKPARPTAASMPAAESAPRP